MYSGISGLRVHQTKLDVIGNNIANVNTVGFKSSRTVFQEVYNQTLKAASAPTPDGNRGGSNPQQVGLGVSIASIDVLHTSSGVQRTDKATDLAIEGNGFFIVSDGETMYYTRAGNFDIDPQGYLVTASGLKVLGWTQKDNDGNIITSHSIDSLSPIRLDSNMYVSPNQTSYIAFSGNLDSRTEVGKSEKYTATVVDSLGNEHPIILEFTRASTGSNLNRWNVKITSPEILVSGQPRVLANFYISFDENGRIEEGSYLDEEDGFYVYEIDDIDFENGSAEIDNLKIRFNIDNTTQHAREFSIKVTDTDGYGPGTLDTITIDSSGQVIGIYSNGLIQTEAILALASFNNPAGLTKLGNNLFYNTPNSGSVNIGQAGTRGLGDINPGALEMSNVDLAYEFTEMITAQRGFQANSRIITTSDEVLQELVNLKR